MLRDVAIEGGCQWCQHWQRSETRSQTGIGAPLSAAIKFTLTIVGRQSGDDERRRHAERSSEAQHVLAHSWMPRRRPLPLRLPSNPSSPPVSCVLVETLQLKLTIQPGGVMQALRLHLLQAVPNPDHFSGLWSLASPLD